MNWFFLALVSSALYASTNHIDKYLIQKYLHGKNVGALLIFSALFSIFALPIIFFIHSDVLSVSLIEGIILAVNGSLIVLAILLYFYALRTDDASIVVPFYQTIPILTFILGYAILGETIVARQFLAGVLIIVGALILSFKLGKSIRFRKIVVIFMLLSSLCYAINGVIFKFVAIERGFWPSVFWGLIGKIIIGVIFLLFVSQYREQFFVMLRKNRVAVLSVNSLNETLSIVAEAISQFAMLLAPVVLVTLVYSFQPAFVFVFGILLTLFLPRVSQESLKKDDLIQRITGIGFMIVGSYFIS